MRTQYKRGNIDGYARTRIGMSFSTEIYSLLMGGGAGVWGQFVLDVCDRLLTRDAARARERGNSMGGRTPGEMIVS